MSDGHFSDPACEAVLRQLDAYLSHELTDEVRAEIERHLPGCSQCADELEARGRLRAHLKAAVRAQPVPEGLESKVRNAVRGTPQAQHARWRAGWYAIAAAALIVICLALVNLWRLSRTDSEEAILRKTTGRMSKVLNVGLRDHLECAVRRDPKAPAAPAAEMADELGPDFAALLPVVESKLPPGFRVVSGHRCWAGRRQYVHFIVMSGNKVLSLILTRKQPGEWFDSGIYQTGVDRYQVVGFESHDDLAFVISDLDAQQNLQVAALLVPAVRDYLAAHQG